MKAFYQKRNLHFKKPAATSRGKLFTKPSWYLYLYDEENPAKKGIGECSVIPGLSFDNIEKIDFKLSEVCLQINTNQYDFKKSVRDFPAINFAIETALADYHKGCEKIIYPSDFTKGKEGIKINGLIWMSSQKEMISQIRKKIEQGYSCVKMKIGALEFDDELEIIKRIRREYPAEELEIRVDANGAFRYVEATEILKKLSDHHLHSIEQPIMPTQIDEMALLCESSPVPIALDEELIGKFSFENKKMLLELIKPGYIVLKPSLLGGIQESSDYINIAHEFGIGWWVTSALESNIALNTIAQWTYTLGNKLAQGLGTGSLYEKNVESPLTVKGEKLFYDSGKNWSFEFVY